MTSPPRIREKLAQMKEMFAMEAAKNSVLPGGRGPLGAFAAP